MKSKDLLDLILKAIDDKRGENILAYDMQGVSLLSDYIVIAHGNSNRQVHAIVDGIVEALKKADYYNFRVEGNKNSNWLLIDTHDVIVNIFDEETREFYGLEKLWTEAKEIDVESIVEG